MSNNQHRAYAKNQSDLLNSAVVLLGEALEVFEATGALDSYPEVTERIESFINKTTKEKSK